MVLEKMIQEMDRASKKMLTTEPESIKKLTTGDIPSDAGIGKQYFSTMVFALVYSLTLGEHVIYHIIDCCDNKDMSIETIKKMLDAFLGRGFQASSFLGYVMDPGVQKYANEILANLNEIKDKETMRAMLGAYLTYINALHWWLHVRFPWGLGVAFQKKETGFVR